MSVKGTECSELCGVMYVEPSVLKSHAGEQGTCLYSVRVSQKGRCTWHSWLNCKVITPNCKHARRPNMFQKEAAQQVSPCKPISISHFANEFIHVLSSVYINNVMQCNWKVQNHTQGPQSKNNCILYTIYPPKKNYFCIITLLNAWGLVTGTSVLLDEKCLSFKTEVYLLLSMFSENCLWSDLQDFLLRPYAGTQRKPKVSLADLIRSCLFTQWLMVTLRVLLFVVFILRFVKTGTPTLLSFANIRSSAVKKAKCDGSLFEFFVEQFGNPSNTSK